MNKVISEMFAFITVDPKDNSEGIIGMEIAGKWMPFVGADMDRIKSLMPLAKNIASKEGIKFKVLKFSMREDITGDIK